MNEKQSHVHSIHPGRNERQKGQAGETVSYTVLEKE